MINLSIYRFILLFFLFPYSVFAHISYTGRNLGTWSSSAGNWSVTGNNGSLLNGMVSITAKTLSTDYGWARAANSGAGDCHEGEWFRFTVSGTTGAFFITATGGTTNFDTRFGVYPYDNIGPRFLPAYTIYRGLASGAHEGPLNALGDSTLANDAGTSGALIYVGSAADGTSFNFGSNPGIQGDGLADGIVKKIFILQSGDYSIFVGGANYSGSDMGNYGANLTFGVVPEPSTMAFIGLILALFALVNMNRKKKFNLKAMGVNSHSKPSEYPELRAKAGFTIIELLVVISIICILAALGLPISRAVLEKGNATQCLGNLRNIGMAAMSYAADNAMKLPMTSHKGSANQWAVTLQPYASDSIKFKCPSDPTKSRERSFAINDMLTPNPCKAVFLDYSYLSKIDRPSETIYFAESSKDFSTDHFHFSEFYGDQVPPEAFEEFIDVKRHGGSSNYLFTDGHSEQLSWEQVKKRLENPKDRLTDPTR